MNFLRVNITFLLGTATFLQFLVNVFAAPQIQIVFPPEEKEKKWFHNETSECYVSGKQGPCPPSMVFYRIDNTSFGDCDCPRPSTAFSSSPVSVYDIASNQCYHLYEQAFCSQGEWLVIDNSGVVSCAHNPCRSLQRQNPDMIISFYNNTCVRIGQPSVEAGCPSPYEITMDQLSGIPICTSSSSIASYDLSVRRKFACRPGTRRDRLGNCRQVQQVSFKP